MIVGWPSAIVCGRGGGSDCWIPPPSMGLCTWIQVKLPLLGLFEIIVAMFCYLMGLWGSSCWALGHLTGLPLLSDVDLRSWWFHLLKKQVFKYIMLFCGRIFYDHYRNILCSVLQYTNLYKSHHHQGREKMIIFLLRGYWHT